MDRAGLVLIGLFFLIINLTCAAMVWLGVRFFDQMGRYPSKTPAIQLSVFWKLIVVEIITMFLLLAVYHALVDYSHDVYAYQIFKSDNAPIHAII